MGLKYVNTSHILVLDKCISAWGALQKDGLHYWLLGHGDEGEIGV